MSLTPTLELAAEDHRSPVQQPTEAPVASIEQLIGQTRLFRGCVFTCLEPCLLLVLSLGRTIEPPCCTGPVSATWQLPIACSQAGQSTFILPKCMHMCDDPPNRMVVLWHAVPSGHTACATGMPPPTVLHAANVCCLLLIVLMQVSADLLQARRTLQL